MPAGYGLVKGRFPVQVFRAFFERLSLQSAVTVQMDWQGGSRH